MELMKTYDLPASSLVAPVTTSSDVSTQARTRSCDTLVLLCTIHILNTNLLLAHSLVYTWQTLLCTRPAVPSSNLSKTLNH